MEELLRTHDLSVSYGSTEIIHAVDISIRRAEIAAIIGPNGSGKSTLLKALARLLKPRSGVVEFLGTDIWSRTEREIAQRIAFLPQSADPPGDITVLELVRMGRLPHRKFWDTFSKEDGDICREALMRTGMESFAMRPIRALSGGERQRARLAMALAQQPEALLLDEPTTYLDIRHQLALMELVEELHDALGLTVVMVLHDLNQAVRSAQRLIAVCAGEILADGAPNAVFTRELVRGLYGVESRVSDIDIAGRQTKLCLPERVAKDLAHEQSAPAHT